MSTPHTARRRWTREITNVVDGIAFGATGPVLLHGYDPPAGGMWIDDVIPGKLAALDRQTGETIWVSPCEVGYGRGFGAGIGSESDVLVLGPSSSGHRFVRMSLATGELLGAAPIEVFDTALVAGDLCLCAQPKRIFALASEAMAEVWEYRREGERYHHLARTGDHLFVTFSNRETKRQGVLALDARTGDFEGVVLSPTQPIVHGIAVNEDGLVALTRDLSTALPPEVATQYATELATSSEDALADTLALLALPLDARPGDAPLWYEILSTAPVDELPEVSITADAGKLYVQQGALLEVHDTLTGRRLGAWAVPGLDERVAWEARAGAGLLAEESRVSVFEVPA